MTDILLPQVLPRQPLQPASLDSSHLPHLTYPLHLPTTAAATRPVAPQPLGVVDRPFTPYLASLGHQGAWGIHKLGARISPAVFPSHSSPNALPSMHSASKDEKAAALIFGPLRGNVHPFSYVTQAAGMHAIELDVLHTALPTGGVLDVQVIRSGSVTAAAAAAATLTGGAEVALVVTCSKPCVGSGLIGVCRLNSNLTLGVSQVELSSVGLGMSCPFFSSRNYACM